MSKFRHDVHDIMQFFRRLLRKAWQSYTGLFRGRPWYVKLLSGFLSFVVAMLLYLGAVDINFLGLFGKSPSMQTILSKRPAMASEIFSADSVLIGKFFSENRTPVTFEEVNPVFWQALIDTEDERFYSHFGVDFQAFFAALKDYVIHHDARGASTITQQLAKNLFRVRTEYSTGLLGNIPGLRMLIMKSKEWITAVKLEAHFSKPEILTMYANTVDFGSNSFGIKTACKTYFGISPNQLQADQAAILVGMLKATTTYNPRLHPENSLRRRNVVLSNMLSHGHLTPQEYEAFSSKEIELDYTVETTYDGLATYFREAVAADLRRWCRENGYDIYTDGLRIYTTLDTRMQRYAEQAAREQMEHLQEQFYQHWAGMNPWQDEHYREIRGFIENIARRLPLYSQLQQRFPNSPDSVTYYLNKPHKVRLFSYKGTIEREMSTLDSIRYMEHFMHCGFVAMEPRTGHIKAWVGDIDFDTWKYDKVTAQRQPGSTFKLFVYTEAINQGATPCDHRTDSYVAVKLWDSKRQKDAVWSPSNANGSFSGANMTLKRAFAQSINSIAVKLGQEVGMDRVAQTAHAMGIKSNLSPTPALALGASDVSLLELVNAYSTVVNEGKTHEPVLVTKIMDRDGRLVYLAPSEQRQAIPVKSAFLMQQMLMGGMREPGGTSTSLWHYVRPFDDTEFGGKTGTSNNHSDAWFVGVSPRLVCGAWVGGEYRAIHFRTGRLGQGSRTALPICGGFFQRVLADKRFARYHAKFSPPRDADVRDFMYNCSGYYVQPADSLDDMGVADEGITLEDDPDGNRNSQEAVISDEDIPIINAESDVEP